MLKIIFLLSILLFSNSNSRFFHSKWKKEHKLLLPKLNGFYGLIGPNIDFYNTTSLYQLFTGDGHIQGVFLEDGNITFIQKFIHTDKFLYEKKNGNIPKNIFSYIFFMFFHIFNLTPNILDVANTSVMKIKNKTYALFERDKPYEINIDFDNYDIKTIKKINLKNKYFSAHSKYNYNVVESIDYDILNRCVNYILFNENFDLLQKIKIPTKYIPIIHDFYSTKNNIIVIDSPLVFHFNGLKIPIKLDKNKNTIIHVVNKNNGIIEKYKLSKGYYIFHYADFFENNTTMEIYAPLYENLDFDKLNIKGNYRKILIDKRTCRVILHKNDELEKYNLDFPIKYENKVILRNIENGKINGFVICEKISIIKKIFYENRCIYGEPSITYIDNIPYLLFFSFAKNVNYLSIIDLINYEEYHIPMSSNINYGFHSFFVNYNNS